MNNLDFTNLQKMVDEKFISVRKHDTLDISIYNYTQSAQFKKVWNNETLQARGLIINSKHQIVSRSFPKFFNLEEMGPNPQLPLEDFEVTEKADGSLMISYFDQDGKLHIATRGSFISDQAIWGQQIFDAKYTSLHWNPSYTYLWEGIFPQNRIVIDYKGMNDLILLAVIDTYTGKEFPYEKLLEWYGGKMPIVKRYDGIKDIAKLKELEEPNKEGFVIRFAGGLRVKCKFPEYVRLHRLVTGVNARLIWDLLRNKQSINELLERVPEEFSEWVTSTKQLLEAQFAGFDDSARWTWETVKDLPTRKEQAQAIFKKESKLSGVVFKMLDKQPYEDMIWQLIKPVHETPFKMEI